MAYIVHENQLPEMLEDLRQENPGVSDDVLIQFITRNPDIKIMKSGKIGNTQSITDRTASQSEDALADAFGIGVNDKGEIVNKKEIPEATKQEKIDYSKQFDDNQYSKIWKDSIKGFDETEPFMSNAEKVAEAYRKLRDEKNKITDEYDSGQGGDKDIYLQKIKSISNAMREAENSPEFKYLVNHIKENGITWEDKNFSPMVSTTLTDMARHDGSLYGLKPAKTTGGRMSNWILGDVANSGFVRFMQGVTPQKENSLESLPEIYNESNKRINEIINKNKGGDKESNKKETKTSDKNNKGGISSIAEETFTDSMKFGDDAASVGNGYVDKRNNTLSMHLKERGLDTPEKIDQYLSKYPSWKNAKQEWKDNTLVSLTGMVKELKNKDIKKGEDKKETKKETKKEINTEDKKEKTNNKDVNLWKPGKDWLPDMNSSINGTEEEDDTLIYDKKGNPVGSKASKKQDKKDTKKNNKDIIKVVKSSPTIKNLLKSKK